MTRPARTAVVDSVVDAAVGAVVAAAVAAVVLLALAVPFASAETGRGTTGTWTMVWRISETGKEINFFRPIVGDSVAFPFRARVLDRITEPCVALFDGNGDLEGEIALEPGERALVAENGSAHLVWRPEPLHASQFEYRFYRSENPEPAWDAVAPGEPMLFAPDGSLFVIVSPDTSLDRFQRAWLHPGGRVEVVDATGDIRGELPILPVYARLTGDQQRIALLHPGELVVLKRSGVLDWSEDVPIDAVVAREGHSQLEAAGGRIVVSGTGQIPPEEVRGLMLHAERRGTLRVFADDGRLLWKQDQDESDVLWFQISLALSADGGTLATFHSTARELQVRVYDTDNGETLFRASTPRRSGTSSLSVSPDGQIVLLAHGDLRTSVVAWTREGHVVWQGDIPYPARVARIASGGLLVAERWIVRLEPDGE